MKVKTTNTNMVNTELCHGVNVFVMLFYSRWLFSKFFGVKKMR